MHHEPTEEQAGIEAAAARGESVEVNAYAGTGKTTTAVLVARAISRRVPRARKLFVAFNKTIQEEVSERLRTSTDWEVRTLNSLGQGTLLANRSVWAWGGPNEFPRLDDKKNEAIVGQLLGRHATREWAKAAGVDDEIGETLVDLMAKAKVFGVRPEAVTAELLVALSEVESGLDRESVSKDAVKKSQSAHILEGLAKLVTGGLKLSIEQARKKGVIDFNDQVYLAVLYCPHHGRSWDITIVDEGQDLSALNHQQVLRATQQQLIVLGDRHQTLYQFRGATEDSMTQLGEGWRAKTEQTLAKHKLTITFRCPVAVVHRQRLTVGIDDFKARGAAPLGSITMPYVSRAPSLTWSGAGVLNRLRAAGPDKRAVFLSATNAPLYMMAALLWQDLHCQTVADFKEDVRTVCEPPAKGKLNLATTVSVLSLPQYRTRADLAGLFVLHKVSGLNSADLLKLFTPDPNLTEQPLTLSTVHRAKGLEWDHVYLVEPSAMGEHGNIRYVAETRTRHSLGTVSFEDHFRAAQNGDLVNRFCGRSRPFIPLTDPEKRANVVVADQIEANLEYLPAWPGGAAEAERVLAEYRTALLAESPYQFDSTGYLWQGYAGTPPQS